MLSDIALDYGTTGDRVQNIKSVVQKLGIVFGTVLGSVKWRPNFGCHVHRRLFEPCTTSNASWISTDLEEAIENPANEIRSLIGEYKVATTVANGYYLCNIVLTIVLPNGQTIDDISLTYELSSAGNRFAFNLMG